MLWLFANMANVCPICKCNLTYGHHGNTFNDITYNDFFIMAKIIAFNMGGISHNTITYNINKCNITYMFLSSVKSKAHL